MLKSLKVNKIYTPLFILLLSIATVNHAKAQAFGGNPPSIKWNQVNTPVAKVIFPHGLDSAGTRVANIVQRMSGVIQPSIGYKQRQISIVLQNQTTIANAYVGLAPYRSEFFLTPEQNSFAIGSLPWTDQLAIHEFRHVQQYNNFNVGVSRALRIIFGEGGQALGNDISVPNWFFEGDAVYNETQVSEQGRGRLPFFFSGYRALWAAGKNYSYMKLRNGSYLDYTPDHYQLGYMLVAYGRQKFGDYFWKNVTHDAAAFTGGLYPFQQAVKRYSGENFRQFRNDGLNFFKKEFTLEDKKEIISSAQQSKHFIGDQEYPAFVNDGTIIYLKSTYNHIPVFVIKTGNQEKRISVRAISLDNHFDYNNGKIVYASYRTDIRWSYRNYSELELLDVKTGTQKRITSRSKYFSPGFSPDGKRIVTVQVAPSGKSELHLLNGVNGKLIAIMPNPGNLFFTYPKFYGNDNLISAVRNKEGKMSLAMMEIKTGKIHYLLPYTYQPIAFPTVYKDKVYFTATSGTNDRLFYYSLVNNQLYQLKNSGDNGSIGNYQPAVSDNKLAWVGFTAFGYRLSEKNKKDLIWEPVNKIPGELSDFNITTLEKDSAANLLATINDKPLVVSSYKKSHHLFNFHSLIPNINDPNYTLALEGENVLNTLQSQLSFKYNRNEGYKQLGFDATYGALFPYISGGADYTISRRGHFNGGNIYWNETDLHGGFTLPLNLSADKHITGLAFGTDVFYNKTSFQPAYKSLVADRSYTYLNYRLNFSNHIQQAKQNIYPRFGQSVVLNYKSAITGFKAHQFLASANLFLPGLLVNHNLIINAAHQQKGKGNVIDFSNDFPFSRGYTTQNLYRMDKLGASYHFPIAYPDAGVANIVYLLRLRGNIFYDYTRANDFYTSGRQFKGTFRTAGSELFFDTNWFNQTRVSFGVRYSYLVDKDLFGGKGHNRVELVLPVTIF